MLRKTIPTYYNLKNLINQYEFQEHIPYEAIFINGSRSVILRVHHEQDPPHLHFTLQLTTVIGVKCHQSIRRLRVNHGCLQLKFQLQQSEAFKIIALCKKEIQKHQEVGLISDVSSVHIPKIFSILDLGTISSL